MMDIKEAVELLKKHYEVLDYFEGPNGIWLFGLGTNKGDALVKIRGWPKTKSRMAMSSIHEAVRLQIKEYENVNVQ